MDDLDRYIDKQMKDPAFKKEWDDHELEYQVLLQILHMRSEQHLTQAELAARTGLRQSNISRIEKGESVPTIPTLSRIAKGLGKKLEIRFV